MAKNKCDACTACKDCSLLELGKLLEQSCNEFIHIHNTTSDVVFGNQLMYRAAMDGKGIATRFRIKVKSIGIEF